MQTKTGIKAFPITHTNRYRQANFIDINNLVGRGCNAIYSATGWDKSNILFLANSLEEYLSQHYVALRDDRFFVHQGEITVFRKNPVELGGSVSVTQGIQVEVQAIIWHMFCRFDKQIFESVPKHFFVYHVRISVPLPGRTLHHS